MSSHDGLFVDGDRIEAGCNAHGPQNPRDDPDVPIDNHDSERALRKVSLVRNHSMFASDPEGARRDCVPWTLIGTGSRIGVEPFASPEWALPCVVPPPRKPRPTSR